MTVAVIFTSTRAEGLDDEYAATAARMDELARQQPGFVDIVSVRDPQTRAGVTVSYWLDADAAQAWKANPEHLAAQRRGWEAFYVEYRVVVAEVLRGLDSPGRP
jgi:heme-degrading monooxygenase HmoA